MTANKLWYIYCDLTAHENEFARATAFKFEKPDWARNPEFGLLDTVLEQHPELIKIAEADVLRGCLQSEFGRQDMPRVEQIVRTAIYKEMKGLEYRELEYGSLITAIRLAFRCSRNIFQR